MENTLVKGDRVIVNELVPSPISLQRGDVIVFEDPDHWLPATVPVQRSPLMSALNSTMVFVGLLPNDTSNHLIKRVIGLPGDHVVCCNKNKQLTVNGAALTEPYLFPGDSPSQESFNIIVPAGKVWVMGDHRSQSGDSRPHDEPEFSSWGRESPDWERWSPITQTFPAGTMILNDSWLGESPGKRYGSVNAAPFTVSCLFLLQQTTWSPGRPMTRLMRWLLVSLGSKPTKTIVELRALMSGERWTGTVAGNQ